MCQTVLDKLSNSVRQVVKQVAEQIIIILILSCKWYTLSDKLSNSYRKVYLIYYSVNDIHCQTVSDSCRTNYYHTNIILQVDIHCQTCRTSCQTVTEHVIMIYLIHK